MEKEILKENADQLKIVENEIKLAYKEGQYDAIKKIADQINPLDPESRLAAKLLQKAEILKKKQEAKEKAKKIEEYDTMLKQLYRLAENQKFTALAQELGTFAPESRLAKKWLKKLKN